MSKFEEYRRAKASLAEAQRWYSMVGKTYYGGTSGAGELGSIKSSEVEFTIYFQANDGDKNYHHSPSDLNKELSEVAMSQSKDLIEKGIANLRRRANALAKEAAAEYRQILENEGIEV